MDFIIILIVLFVIFGNIKNKKKQQEAQEARRRAAQAQQGGQPQSFDMPYAPPTPTMEGKDADPRFPDYTPPVKQAVPVQQAATRSLQQQPTRPQPMQQRQAPPPQQRHMPPPQSRSQTPNEGEGTQLEHAATSVKAYESTLQAPQGRRHILEASSTTGHAHTESSMSGVQEACPPAQRVTISLKTSPKSGIAALMTDKDALRQAVLYSEILGKPKALRR